jgi:hypothetical protein
MSTKLMAVDFEVFGKVSVISYLEEEFNCKWSGIQLLLLLNFTRNILVMTVNAVIIFKA